MTSPTPSTPSPSRSVEPVADVATLAMAGALHATAAVCMRPVQLCPPNHEIHLSYARPTLAALADRGHILVEREVLRDVLYQFELEHGHSSDSHAGWPSCQRVHPFVARLRAALSRKQP